MAQQQLKKIPAITRNPLLILEMADELREHADNVAKAAAESGRERREATRVLKIRAFARELQDLGDAKMGTHAEAINRDQ